MITQCPRYLNRRLSIRIGHDPARALARFALGLVMVSVLVPAAWAGDGLVALQTADAACPSASSPPPRYVDCGNGTVTDNKTGLVWLKNAGCFEETAWDQAVRIVAGLSDLDDGFCDDQSLSPADCDCGLSDGSSPGEWRLPSASEWETMIEDAVDLGCCFFCSFGTRSITNDLGSECWQEGPGNSFTGVPLTAWASNIQIQIPANQWFASLEAGAVGTLGCCAWPWPVRGGQ